MYTSPGNWKTKNSRITSKIQSQTRKLKEIKKKKKEKEKKKYGLKTSQDYQNNQVVAPSEEVLTINIVHHIQSISPVPLTSMHNIAESLTPAFESLNICRI